MALGTVGLQTEPAAIVVEEEGAGWGGGVAFEADAQFVA